MLYNGFKRVRQPPKIAPFRRRIWIPSNTWFLGPTGVTPNGISICSDDFAWFTNMANYQNTTLSVAIGRICAYDLA